MFCLLDQIGNDSYGTTGKVAKSTNLSFPVFPCGVMESVFRILTLCKETLHPKPTPPQGLSSPCKAIYVAIQWNLSIKAPLNKGHLSNEDSACSPNHIELCTNLPLN